MIHQVEIVRVIDGDTVVVDVNLGFGSGVWLRDKHARLARINAPETTTPEGIIARDRMKEIVAQAGNKSFLAECKKLDKYGRLLIELTLPNGTNISDLMVQGGFAQTVKYGMEFEKGLQE